MRIKIIIYIFITYICCLSLYSQSIYNSDLFYNFLTNYSLEYDKNILEDIDYLKTQDFIIKYWSNAYNKINNLGSSNWGAINGSVSNIHKYTDDNDVAFFIGAVKGMSYFYESGMDRMGILFEALKRKINMSAASGDNYGLIIPMHFPLGTAGISAYVNWQLPDSKIKGESYYLEYIRALERVPIPYVQIFGQINCWTAPLSIGLKFAFAPGLSGLYKPFIKDIEVLSTAYHAGLDMKFYIWRNKYFFADARLDFNFDMGEISLSSKSRNYFFDVPIENAVNSGVIFNLSQSLGGKWTSFALTPKVVFGFKFQEKVPVIDYFAAYFLVGVDLIYSFADANYNINSDIFLNSPNSKNDDYNIKNAYTDKGSRKSQYFAYDVRFGLNIDIFYQSLSIEYALFSKSFSIMFMPFVYRFVGQ
ncbi:hypothetical protein [uncultured Brachyspira sp.]|uniref:hypothetical protein n=1 Tax=uncultured Brachyspira sp. TaxID=221953 RepID=UPI0025CE5D82|nr:hypothetical protein [uncultured Brachyspira sp.]